MAASEVTGPFCFSSLIHFLNCLPFSNEPCRLRVRLAQRVGRSPVEIEELNPRRVSPKIQRLRASSSAGLHRRVMLTAYRGVLTLIAEHFGE